MKENHHKDLLINMKIQNAQMATLIDTAEKIVPQASLYFDTVCRDLETVVNGIEMSYFKSKRIQNTPTMNEKDVLNVAKVLELILAIIMDKNKIDDLSGRDSSFTHHAAMFRSQMDKIKQQIDLMLCEITKVKTVNETLENIVSNHKLELAAVSSIQENEEGLNIVPFQQYYVSLL